MLIGDGDNLPHEVVCGPTTLCYCMLRKMPGAGGIIEDIAPSLKYCTDQEFYELMDYVFSMPQVQEFITKQLKIVL